jgi:putative ABC transport system permease protein
VIAPMLPRWRRGDAATGVPDPPSLSPRDLVAEATAGIVARPVRSALTTLGTVLGIATLVITLGVAATASNQIVGRFDALRATEVTVDVPKASEDGGGPELVRWGAVDDVTRLNGVRAAASLTDLDATPMTVEANEIRDPAAVAVHSLPVVGTTTGLLETVGGHVVHGRFFDAGHVDRTDRVAVLGEEAAKLLGVDRVDRAPAVFVGGKPLTVIGVLGGIARQPRLASAVIVPHTTARRALALGTVRSVMIKTDLGAARLVATQAPRALSPNDAERLAVTAPPDPESLRNQVENDINGLFLVLGLVSLVVGAVGIANVTLVTVMERTGEIGLRRALGAARRHIAWQFLAESTLIGLLGGIIGATTGILAVVGVSVVQGWTPVLDQALALGAPPVGALVGLLAGLYPSLRAARMEPVDALRSGT